MKDRFRRGESRSSKGRDEENDNENSRYIKIGANVVEVVDREEYLDDANLFGKFDASQFLIALDSGSCEQSRTMTLIHELQHVFQFRAGLRFSEELDEVIEALIDSCSTGFFDFFREQKNIWAIAEILGVDESELGKIYAKQK